MIQNSVAKVPVSKFSVSAGMFGPVHQIATSLYYAYEVRNMTCQEGEPVLKYGMSSFGHSDFGSGE